MIPDRPESIRSASGDHVPVQLVWGDRDPFFPVDKAKEMVGDFPNVELEIISGAGLFSHEERPADVARALIPTLTGTR